MSVKCVSALLVLLFFSLVVTASDTIRVWKRCDYCNLGYCEAMDAVIGSCSKFCNPCTVICSGSYMLEATSSRDEYTFTIYNNNDCTSTASQSIIGCESCYSSGSTCSAYYINCVDNTWLWILGIFVAIIILLFAMAIGFMIYKKQRSKKLLAQGIVEGHHGNEPNPYVTYQNPTPPSYHY